MKYRSFYLSAAFIGMLAGVHCIPAFSVPASAAEVTLTYQETHALFGSSIPCQYRTVNNNLLYDGSFTYCDDVRIGDIVDNTDSNWIFDAPFSAYDTAAIIYEFTPDSQIDTNTFYSMNLHITPTIDISHLTSLKMGFGLLDSTTRYPEFGQLAPNRLANYFSYLVDDSGSITNPKSYIAGWWNWRQSYYVPVNYEVEREESGQYVTYYTSLYQISVTGTDVTFATISDDSQYTDLGLNLREFIYNIDGTYYLVILCPTLSDGYINNRPPESSGGGSESSGGGYDGPDYTDQLALILAKLDLIINNDFNFDVDFSADLSGVESRLDGINSRLDGTNSRLDGNNSRVDGVNSRLDGVNSRLDNISGELHNLNSAPSGTLPRTGAENSEFDRQAEMYLSDFQNEYSDPENQPFEVAEGSSGFLSFVREFLLRSHLAGVLPVLALLFIVHYTIFDRRG